MVLMGSREYKNNTIESSYCGEEPMKNQRGVTLVELLVLFQ